MKKHVFVVDDDPRTTRLIQDGLERSGQFVVRTENDSTLALAAAREFSPDVVLLDIVMPIMDGTDVAAAMRDDDSLRSVPVIFVTSLVDQEEHAVGSFGSGARTYFPKPVNVHRLIAAIEERTCGRAATRCLM